MSIARFECRSFARRFAVATSLDSVWDRGLVVRQWFVVGLLAFAGCGPAKAETVRASISVSATVIDRCTIGANIQAATCTGGAHYAIGVTRERVSLATAAQLTAVGDVGHISGDDPRNATSRSGSGAVAERVGAMGNDPVEAIRVTYSF